MPIYKAAIEIAVDGDDVSWLDDTIDQLREMDGVTVTDVAPFANNPPDYPEYDDDSDDA